MDLSNTSRGGNSAERIEDLNDSAQQKSFESIMKAPYHNHNMSETTRSIESPYTSLGSCRSSYASIKPNSYSSLRARSIKASAQHESKTKAVMNALHNLQEKIGTLEVDRAKAESNLRSLATETSEYKELLKQKHNQSSFSIGSLSSTKRDPHSEGELEHQLEDAQSRCLILEKQLESMRKMMQEQQQPSVPKDQRTNQQCGTVFTAKYHQGPPSLSSDKHSLLSSTVKDTLSHSSTLAASRLLGTVEKVPALEKLNGLEREHVKLSLSQTQAEKKIRELEEKIREEKHCRKLLEDKAFELEQAVTQANLVERKSTNERSNKPKRRRKKKVAPKSSSPSSKTTTPRSPRRQTIPSSSTTNPNHYLLDLASIPFVVGQSTSRSHSVGANIQNVLSIMKSHSRLCEGANGGNTMDRRHGDHHNPTEAKKCTLTHTRHKRERSPRNKNTNFASLLNALVKEFEQLAENHQDLSNRIEHEKSESIRKNDQLELTHLFQKMEAKGKQIAMIRHHMKTKAKSPPSTARSPLQSPHNHTGGRLKIGSQEIEVVTTIRAPTMSRSKKGASSPTAVVEMKKNAHLDLLKKVRKLQYTLQKDDLQWD